MYIFRAWREYIDRYGIPARNSFSFNVRSCLTEISGKINSIPYESKINNNRKNLLVEHKFYTRIYLFIPCINTTYIVQFSLFSILLYYLFNYKYMYDLILLKAYNNELIKILKLYFCQKMRRVFK